MALSRHATLACVALTSVALVVFAPASPMEAARPRASTTTLTINPGINAPFTRNFNPLITSGAVQGTTDDIYEPLYIVSYVDNDKQIPWLASSYKFSGDKKTLTFTIRKGVRWSDGQPFSARDVYYTIMLGKLNPALDQVGLWGKNGLASSVTTSGDTVSIHFKQPNVTLFPYIANTMQIVPQHIFSKVKNLLKFTNPNPVGTGPFTQVKDFSSQSFTLGRNPYYWQKGKPAYDAIQIQDYTANQSADLALSAGKADWSSLFVPDVAQTYAARNPDYHYYFSSRDVPVMLYMNDAKYPFSLPVFRQALSMAIDRQALSKGAEYGYEPPATASGLNGLWVNWVDKKVGNAPATYDPTKARAMLLKAGFKMKGNTLVDPKGHAVSVELLAPSPFTDWVSMAQIMSREFKSLGVAVDLRLLQVSDWVNRMQKGDFDLAINGSPDGATPYDFYHGMIGKQYYAPIGQTAGQDAYGRYKNATMDALFAKFRQTLDSGSQHALAGKMQQIWVSQMPAIPLVVSVYWFEYSTAHFTGWPTAKNYYAAASFYVTPDRLLILTTLRPH